MKNRLQKTIERLRLKIRKPLNNKIYIQCFHSFEVFIDGAAITWKNTRAKEILAFLIHKEGIPVSWEAITEAVWLGMDFEKAHCNFHATMYLLRKRLAELGISDILENARGNYRIKTDKIICDYYEYKKKFVQVPHGYMENNGYIWIYEK